MWWGRASWAQPPVDHEFVKTSKSKAAAAVVFRPDPDVAACGPVPVGVGQPDTHTQRVDHRAAGRGPGAGSYAAAVEPGGVGHLGGDEPGAPVRSRRAGRGRAPGTR